MGGNDVGDVAAHPRPVARSAAPVRTRCAAVPCGWIRAAGPNHLPNAPAAASLRVCSRRYNSSTKVQYVPASYSCWRFHRRTLVIHQRRDARHRRVARRIPNPGARQLRKILAGEGNPASRLHLPCRRAIGLRRPSRQRIGLRNVEISVNSSSQFSSQFS